MSETTITKRDLQSVFWRNMLLQGSINFERLQGLGYAYCILPVLRKLYKSEGEMSVALTRHLGFFNTTPAMAAPILGVNVAMEEQGGNESDEAVRAIKTGMMGPMAGIGDSLLWFTIMPIAMGLGSALAKEGNIFGPILAIVIYNLVNIPLRYYGVMVGYRRSLQLVGDMAGTTLRRVTEGATNLGVLVAGGLVGSLVIAKVPLKFGETAVQGILDSLLPNLLPLLLTLGCLALLKKGVKAAYLIFGVLILGLVLGGVGFLAL